MNWKRIRHWLRLGVTAVVGGAVLLAGFVMLFTPGQGILTILLGLGILATEFPWAARLLKRMKEKFKDAAAELRRRYQKHYGEDAANGASLEESIQAGEQAKHGSKEE